MVDKILFRNCCIQNELDCEQMDYWFDKKDRKFLHQIDTFYYSVKLENDFVSDSADPFVLNFRKFFSAKLDFINNNYDKLLPLNFGTHTLNMCNGSFAGMYKIHLVCSDWFDVFIAPIVPNAQDSVASVTGEIVVQLRSYMLWMFGITEAYERSFAYVQSICSHFALQIKHVQENRIDYCWNTNYLTNPESFFSMDNFYKMRVDRFKGAVIHSEKVGSSDYEVDYIAMGKRSDKVFIRIYLKSKEVIEQGYKAWFFKTWLFNGLINRYDFYVYEKCYLKHSWHYRTMARLEWYSEFGQDEAKKIKCKDYVEGRVTASPTVLHKLADELTPKITLIMNVEYQTMRKHSKSYQLVPFKNNDKYGVSKRIYDYLDNRKLITDYLTHYTLRLVKYEDDDNKSRADYCGFWKSLRHTKMVDCCINTHNLTLIRTYTRNLNAELMKKRALNAAITFGIYTKGINNDPVTHDFYDCIYQLNDNDIYNCNKFKSKKVLKFNESELEDTYIGESVATYSIIDLQNGDLLESL